MSSEKEKQFRKFKTDMVEQEKLNQILEAAILAPTGANKQPQRVYVLRSEEALAKMDQATPCRYGAPLALLVTADKSEAWEWQGYNGYEADAAIVATHLLLAATDAGVGSIWAGIVDQKGVAEMFGLPKDEYAVAFIPLGYTADDYLGNPAHTDRKSMDEIVRYL